MTSSSYDKEDVRARLLANVRSVCEFLLPAGKAMGGHWRVGSVNNERGESLAINLRNGQWFDHATSEKGDILSLWMAVRNTDFATALEQAGDWGAAPRRMNTESRSPQRQELRRPSFDWQACVEALADEALLDIAEERGLSVDFVLWLREHSLIGSFDGHVAFPVSNRTGAVVACHCRAGKNEKGRWNWRYQPTGGAGEAWIIGNPFEERESWIFESQWDAFAFADLLGYHQGKCEAALIITRGATNSTAFEALKDRIPHNARLIAFPQNDPEERRDRNTGKTPAEKWLASVEANCNGATLLTAKTPTGCKDLNDWTRGSPTPDEGWDIIRHAKAAGVLDFYTAVDLLKFRPQDDPNRVLGDRWLCKGSSCLWVGNAGAGKSTLAMQLAIFWALGLAPFGIKPARRLRSLFIQAENDEGDMSEMMTGVFRGIDACGGIGLSQEEIAQALSKQLVFIRECQTTGSKFAALAEKQIAFHKPDLVWIDPLLSFCGDDISQQKVASEFLRNNLNPIGLKHGIVWMVMHHTGKPSKDAGNPLTASQLQYMGMGSSELQNWARAVNVLLPRGEDGYTLTLSKRGKRAGATDLRGEKTKTLYLQHAAEGLFWEQIDEPAEEEKAGSTRYSSRYNDGDILKHLHAEEGTSYSTLLRKCKEDCNVSRASLTRILKRLREENRVVVKENAYFRADT